MSTIFLSHSRAGAPLAIRVCQYLKETGYGVMLAERAGVGTGADRALHRTWVRGCDLCLLMMLPGEAQHDSWLGYEIAMAAAAGKRTIVVPVDDAQYEIDLIPSGLVEFWALAAADRGYRFISLEQTQIPIPMPQEELRVVA